MHIRVPAEPAGEGRVAKSDSAEAAARELLACDMGLDGLPERPEAA